MSSSDTFQDFCVAWRSRFPHSELPAAWEEDVRANLAKHQARVTSLRWGGGYIELQTKVCEDFTIVEKALVGAFSVIVKNDGSFAALLPVITNSATVNMSERRRSRRQRRGHAAHI